MALPVRFADGVPQRGDLAAEVASRPVRKSSGRSKRLSTRGLVWVFVCLLGLAAWPALPAALTFGGVAVVEPVLALLVVAGTALLRRAGLRTDTLTLAAASVMAATAAVLLVHLLAAPGRLVGAYSDVRAILVLVVVAVAMRAALETPLLHDLLAVAMPVVSGLLLAATLVGPAVVGEAVGTKRSFPVAFFVVSAVLARRVEVKTGRWLVALPLTALFVSAVLGFFRYYFVVALVTVVGLAVDYVRRTSSGQRRGAILRAAVVLMLLVGMSVSFRAVVSDYLSATESRYIQTIGKSQRLAQAVAGSSALDEGDELRFAYYEALVRQPAFFLYPRLLGHDGYIGSVGIERLDNLSKLPANPIDSGLFFVVFFVGIPVAVTLAALLARSVTRGWFAVLRSSPGAVPLVATPTIVWLLIFLVTGNMFVAVPHAVAFGALTGLLGQSLRPKSLQRVLARP